MSLIVTSDGHNIELSEDVRSRWEVFNFIDDATGPQSEYQLDFTSEEVLAFLAMDLLGQNGVPIMRGTLPNLSSLEHIVAFMSPVDDSWRTKVIVDAKVMDRRAAFLLLGRWIRRHGVTYPIDPLTVLDFYDTPTELDTKRTFSVSGDVASIAHEELDSIREDGSTARDKVLGLDWLSILTGIVYSSWLAGGSRLDMDWEAMSQFSGGGAWQLLSEARDDIADDDTDDDTDDDIILTILPLSSSYEQDLRRARIMDAIETLLLPLPDLHRSHVIDAMAGTPHRRRQYVKSVDWLSFSYRVPVDEEKTAVYQYYLGTPIQLSRLDSSLLPYRDPLTNTDVPVLSQEQIVMATYHLLKTRDRRAHPSQLGLSLLFGEAAVFRVNTMDWLRKTDERRWLSRVDNIDIKQAAINNLYDTVPLEDPVAVLYVRYGSGILSLITEAMEDYLGVKEAKASLLHEGDSGDVDLELEEDIEVELEVEEEIGTETEAWQEPENLDALDMPVDVLLLDDGDHIVRHPEVGQELYETDDEYRMAKDFVDNARAFLQELLLEGLRI
jgi:hypothetical protein